jgi:hypothetical protein
MDHRNQGIYRVANHKKVLCFACPCGHVSRLPWISTASLEIAILPMIDMACEEPHCVSFTCDKCGLKVSFYSESGVPDRLDTDIAGMKIEKNGWRKKEGKL